MYERYRKSCILVADSAWNKGLSDPAEAVGFQYSTGCDGNTSLHRNYAPPCKLSPPVSYKSVYWENFSRFHLKEFVVLFKKGIEAHISFQST